MAEVAKKRLTIRGDRGDIQGRIAENYRTEIQDPADLVVLKQEVTAAKIAMDDGRLISLQITCTEIRIEVPGQRQAGIRSHTRKELFKHIAIKGADPVRHRLQGQVQAKRAGGQMMQRGKKICQLPCKFMQDTIVFILPIVSRDSGSPGISRSP